MNILLLGSGGREHALAWKMADSPLTERLYCAPGNAGIAREATCVQADLKNVDELVQLAHRIGPDLTIVGPELPLSLGVADEIDNAVSFFERTFITEVPRVHADVARLLGREPASFLRVGSWVGGDRDGNPNVTAATYRKIERAKSALRRLEAAAEQEAARVRALQDFVVTLVHPEHGEVKIARRALTASEAEAAAAKLAPGFKVVSSTLGK